MRRHEVNWEELRTTEKMWEERDEFEKLRWHEMGWVETTWHKKSWEGLSWDKLRRMENWEELKGGEFRWANQRWEKSNDMRRDENSPDQLRRAEKSREDMRWDAMNWGDSPEKTRHEMRWDGWDDADCGGNGMQWTVSKRSCEAMRSNEMRKGPTLKDMAPEWKVKRIVAAKHRRLARALWAHSLFRSIVYRRFNFETSAPGLPGHYL